jgi:hypothetical protein
MPEVACRLCGNKRQLRESHVFPKGIYARFVSDKRRGGSLLDLRNMREHSIQFKRRWFCAECEQRLDQGGENYFFRWLNSIEPTSAYEPMLHYFAVSVSWRCALLHFETTAGIEHIADALESWRSYLLGTAAEIGPYSQYLLSLNAPKWDYWNRGLGGTAVPNHHLVFSVLGPFAVLGITHPDEFTDAEKMALAPAELRPDGGAIQVDEVTTDGATAVSHVRAAFEFWQTVAKQKLSVLAQKLACPECGKLKSDCTC